MKKKYLASLMSLSPSIEASVKKVEIKFFCFVFYNTYHHETFQRLYISSNDNTGNDYDLYVIWNIVDFLYMVDIGFFAEWNDERIPVNWKRKKKIKKNKNGHIHVHTQDTVSRSMKRKSEKNGKMKRTT